jgi:hypothetical protein
MPRSASAYRSGHAAFVKHPVTTDATSEHAHPAEPEWMYVLVVGAFWLSAFLVSVTAFLVWGIREGWRYEPDARLRRKLLNTKTAPWGMVTCGLFGLVLITRVFATIAVE